MGPDRALNLINEMLWQAAIIGGPILLATLGVGLIVSVFQVATQIQEITLSYVPKLFTAGFLLVGLGPWMVARLTGFARGLFLIIPSLGG